MNIMRRVCGAMRLELTVLTAAALLPFGIARVQGTAGNGTPKPQMMATDAEPDWEVATVRPSNPDDTNGQRIRFRGRYVMILDHTVEDILLIGYGVQKSQLAGEPDWVKTERWDVDGVPDAEGEPNMSSCRR